MIPVIAIVGPTAIGKTALGVQLAREFHGEIVSADSRQIYRHMDIGSGKPTPEERASVPHHLLDLVEPDGEYNVAYFVRDAAAAIADIHSRGAVPFLVGGTGHYVWALLGGLNIPNTPPNPELRAELAAAAQSEGGMERLSLMLRDLDPVAASRIDPRNVRRIIRAIEVSMAGVPFSRAGTRSAPPYRTLILGLTTDRADLYRRIDQRVDAMVQQGWIEEVRRLLDAGFGIELPSMSSIGYRPIAEAVMGRILMDEAIQRIKHDTHRFARRQYAWFRITDPRIQWLDVRYDALAGAREAIRRFLDNV